MKFSGRKLVSLTIGVFGAVWALAVLILAGMRRPAIPFAGSLLFGIVATVIAVIYLSYFRFSPGRQAVEQGALSVIVTVAYVVISLVANTALIPVEWGGFNRYLLIGNAVINAAYMIVILYVEQDTRRLKGQLDRTEQKTAAAVSISGRLGSLLGVAEGDEVRRRLLKLKEAVDYGTNISTVETEALEQQMALYLDELMGLLMANSREELIMEQIRQAEQCWKIRSNIASSTK